MPAPSPEPFVPPRALVRNPDGPGWWAFERVLERADASAVEDVPKVLERAQRATEEGLWAVGFVGYEAAAALDSACRVAPSTELPLAGFALCEPPKLLPEDALEASRTQLFEVSGLHPKVSEPEHARGVERIKDWIARGSTYQVNYTYPFQGRLVGEAWDLFLSLIRGQTSRYAAWLDLDSHAICSASPELFFALTDERIVSRPMKGTMPRGRTTEEDRSRAAALAACQKNRAENVMIVDMVRNDLARVATPGSVQTTRLLEVERYETVFQLTSTIEARTERSVPEIFGALFPCASITGAPKIRTMELIRDLEKGPRGLYTGAIGWLAPERRAQFSVAIRTAVVERCDGGLTYGTGGGIVWDSEPAAEYAESAAKARILTKPRPRFDLLETLAWRPEGGYAFLSRHLDRLMDSAAYFDFRIGRARVERKLLEAANDWSSPRRVRLAVAKSGAPRVTSTPLGEPTAELAVAWALDPIDSSDPFLFHKTTHREVYHRARRARPGMDDVLLWNESGEVTESTIANVVADLGGRLVTPPISSGLLAGTLRGSLIASGEIEERVLERNDIESADGLYLINSVRGWTRADLREPGSD